MYDSYSHIISFSQSTLLQCLLKELKPVAGLVKINGSVSYVSQDAWVFSGTVRDNILFGLPYKKTWYDAVLEACTLDKVGLICGLYCLIVLLI